MDRPFWTPSSEYQAGIADVKSAIPEMHSDVAEVEIEVRSATVVATDYATDRGEISRSQTNFWIADGDGTMEVRLYHENVTPEEVPQFAVQVGQKISFDVTQVGRYYDKGQIQRGSNWVLEDVDQDVYVWEPDRAFDVADVHQMVRVTALLEGEPSACGGSSRCWNIDYGFGTAVFRTSSNIVDTGLCITYVGPLSWYQDDPQLNVANFSWLKIYN